MKKLRQTIENFYLSEEKKLIDETNSKVQRKLSIVIKFDEQFSRSQRSGSTASFASTVFICDGKVIHISHADASIAEEQRITCKGKSKRNLGLSFLTENLQNIDCLVIDGCASSENRFMTLFIQSFQMLLLLGISGISKKKWKRSTNN
jgi:hypothetical protein